MKNIFKHLTIVLDVFFLVVLVLNYFDYLPAYFKFVWIFYFVLAVNTWYLALKIREIPENKRDEHSLVYVSKYFFLLGLIVIVLNQFLKRQIVVEYMTYIVGLIIALGFLTFYSSRERVEKEIEKEKSKEEEDEVRRKREFPQKFPRLSRVWGVRNKFII